MWQVVEKEEGVTEEEGRLELQGGLPLPFLFCFVLTHSTGLGPGVVAAAQNKEAEWGGNKVREEK